MPDGAAARERGDIVEYLSDPETHGGAPVTRIDTHGSIVFLAGARAYKLKRPVAYPYMDYSTLERREAACRKEFAINSRTTPELYLGVQPIRRGVAGSVSFDSAGPVVDWVLVMRRFPAGALFKDLAAQGRLTAALMDDLAARIADFHAAAEPVTGDQASRFRRVVAENIEELRGDPALFPTLDVDTLERRAGFWLGRLTQLLDRRGHGGWVRRCHGDLHLRNIVLLDGRARLFDAIEFNDEIATIDVLYDLAFLLMDCDHRGLRALGNRVFNRYQDAACDLEGLAAMPLFLSTRAAVRAKVDRSIAAAVPADAERYRQRAAKHLSDAVAYLNPPDPQLIALGGLSGTGKSVAAAEVAPSIGAAPGALILRSDAIRKRMLGIERDRPAPADAYRPDVTRRVYDAIEHQAGAALASGQSVIADAVFARPEERSALADLATSLKVPFLGIWLEADRGRRLVRVAGRCGDISDADERVVALQDGFDIGQLTWTAVDANGDRGSTLAQIRRLMKNV